MVSIEINGKEFHGPASMDEITLDKYIECYPFLNETENVQDKLQEILGLLSTYFKVEKKTLMKCKTADVFQLYYYLIHTIKGAIEEAKKIRSDKFTINEIDFFIPNEKLSDLTFGQLADALKVRQDGATIIEGLTGEKGNEMSYLKLLLPIICRTDNEEFNTKELIDKASFFGGMSIGSAIGIDFFLRSHLNY